MSYPDLNIPTDPLLDCPTCGLPAEITEPFILDGVPAPVEHVKLVCVKGHWYTPPVDQLLMAESDRHRARCSAAVHRSGPNAVPEEAPDGRH